jgi:hypothetical protein
MNSANSPERWTPYPESMLDIEPDVSYFPLDLSVAEGALLDDLAALVGVKRFVDLVATMTAEPELMQSWCDEKASGAV